MSRRPPAFRAVTVPPPAVSAETATPRLRSPEVEGVERTGGTPGIGTPGADGRGAAGPGLFPETGPAGGLEAGDRLGPLGVGGMKQLRARAILRETRPSYRIGAGDREA